MTNPDNSVGTNGAFGGRTSVNAFNDGIAAYSRGVLSGWACEPSTGMKVTIGGDGSTRDVAIAEDNVGNKTTIDNIGGSPIELTISAAPATNSRIDAIVAYVDNPPQGDSTEVDNFSACGLIVVDGTAASTPTAPDDTAIRTAITADGASGVTAYYAVLAHVTVANGTTDITSADIAADSIAQLDTAGIVPASSLDYSSFGNQSSYIDFGSIRIQFGSQTGGKFDSNATVNLPVAFANANYVVTAVNQFNETGTSRWMAFITGKTANSFTYRSGYLFQGYANFTTNATNVLNWIAIGQKPS